MPGHERGHSIRIGVYLPTFAGGIRADGSLPRYPELVALARDLEAAGFESLWVADELNPRFADGSELGYWEAWTLLTAIATQTSRVRVGPLVLSIGFRNPGLVAKMAVTLDEVSGGRLVLGVGAGYDESEHAMFGMPWAARVARLEEYLAVLRGLLAGESVTFEGRHHSARSARLNPPPRSKTIPIVVGTISIGPRIMRAVARYADGWNGWLAFTDNRPAALVSHLDALAEACQLAGRDPRTIQRSVGISVRLGSAPLRYGPDDYAPIAISGTDEEIAAHIAEFADYGIDEVVLYTFPLGGSETTRLARIVEAVRRLGTASGTSPTITDSRST